MNEVVKLDSVQDKIITLRDQKVIIDSDVAALYGVETRDVNKSVANNPDKFPDGYVIELQSGEKKELVENFHRFNPLKHSTVMPKAFTEKGLYMLATILKSPQATQTTLAIVEAFAQLRELARTVAELSQTKDDFAQKSLMQKGSGLISNLLGDDMVVSDTETAVEVNFAMLKVRHVIKRTKK